MKRKHTLRQTHIVAHLFGRGLRRFGVFGACLGKWLRSGLCTQTCSLAWSKMPRAERASCRRYTQDVAGPCRKPEEKALDWIPSTSFLGKTMVACCSLGVKLSQSANPFLRARLQGVEAFLVGNCSSRPCMPFEAPAFTSCFKHGCPHVLR